MTGPEICNLRQGKLQLSANQLSELLGGLATGRVERWEQGTEAPAANLEQKLSTLSKLANNSDWLDEFHKVRQSSGDLSMVGNSIFGDSLGRWNSTLVAFSTSPLFAVLTEKYLK